MKPRSRFRIYPPAGGLVPRNILQTGKSMHISETQPRFVPEYALGERYFFFFFFFRCSLSTSFPPFFCIPFDQFPPSLITPFYYSPSLFHPGICLMLTISALLWWKPPRVFQGPRSPRNLIQRRYLLSNALNSIVCNGLRFLLLAKWGKLWSSVEKEGVLEPSLLGKEKTKFYGFMLKGIRLFDRNFGVWGRCFMTEHEGLNTFLRKVR